MKAFLRHNGLPILVILLVPLLALYPVSFFQYTMKWDMMDQFYPCRYFIGECLKNGQLPLWCPYINFGYPFHADPQSGAFYPVTWGFSLLGGYNVYAIALEYLLHILIAGLSFYALMRHFQLHLITAAAFGVLYSLSGLFISNAQHLTWVVSMSWMPLLTLAFQRLLHAPVLKHSLAFVMVAYLFITGGYPGYAIIIFYFLLLYALVFFTRKIRQGHWRQAAVPAVSLLSGAVLFALVSAGFFFSVVKAMPDIARSKPVTMAEANSIAFTPQAAVSFLFPFVNSAAAYRQSIHTDISMTNAYMGFLVFPLFILGLPVVKRHLLVMLLLAFGLISLLAALGDVTPVRSWMYHFLPGMNVFRHAAIFRSITMLGVLTVAAFGFDRIVKEEVTRRSLVLAALLPTGIFLLVAGLFFCADNSPLRWLSNLSVPEIQRFNQEASAFSHLLVQALVQLLFLSVFLLVFFGVKNRFKPLLLGMLLMGEIGLAAFLNLPATVISDVRPAALHSAFRKFPQGFPLPPPKPVGDFGYVGNPATAPVWFNISFFSKQPSWGGWNNFYPKGIDEIKDTPVMDFVRSKPLIFAKDSTQPVHLRLLKFEPGCVAFHYAANRPTKLIFLQSNFPGWKAYCDQKPLTVRKSLKNFMQVEVPDGAHQVSFVYEPDFLRIFIVVGVLALCVVTGLWLFLMIRETPVL